MILVSFLDEIPGRLLVIARTWPRIILLGASYSLAALDVVILIGGIVDPARAVAPAFVGAVFVIAACLVMSAQILLLLRGHRVFLARGKGMGAYLWHSACLQPWWLLVAQAVLFLCGISAAFYQYAIGVANASFAADHGQYLITSIRGVTTEVSADYFLRATTAAHVLGPVGVSLAVCMVAAMFLWGDAVHVRRGPQVARTESAE